MNLTDHVTIRGVTIQTGDIYRLDGWRNMAVIGLYPHPHYETAYILWHDVTNSIPSIYSFWDFESLLKEGAFQKVELPKYKNPFTVLDQIDVKVGKVTFPLQTGKSIKNYGVIQEIKLILMHENGVESIVAFEPERSGQYNPFSISFIDPYQSSLIRGRLETISV